MGRHGFISMYQDDSQGSSDIIFCVAPEVRFRHLWVPGFGTGPAILALSGQQTCVGGTSPEASFRKTRSSFSTNGTGRRFR